MRRPRTQGDAEGPPAAGRRWPRPSRPLSGPGEGMRRGPGGSGTEPRCPPGSPRRPSTASRPGEGERGGGERGGGCPLTGRGRGRACSYGVSEGSPPWLQGGGISWVNPNFLGNLGIWGGIQCLCPRSAAGPAERFPVGAVEAILRDVLRGYLQEQPYEPGTCREMAKTIAEVPPWFIRSGGCRVLLLLQGGLRGGPTARSRLYSSSLVGNEASIPLPVPFLVAVNAKLEVLGFFSSSTPLTCNHRQSKGGGHRPGSIAA